MKIYFYINTISHGGAERVMTNLIHEMSQRGHQCKLITTYKKDWEYNLYQDVDRVVLLPELVKSTFKRNIDAVTRLRREIIEGRPDVLVTFMAEPNFRGILATMRTRVKTIVSVRNDPKREYKGWLRLTLARILFKFASLIVFQTDDAKSSFPISIQEKSVIIHNPVNEVFFNAQVLKERSGIVTMGRLTSQKNHSMLIKAFALISDKISDDLYIYGSGNSNQLRELALQLGVQDRVHFPGQCDAVQDVLVKSKLFVLSSDYEGMPNALMEAMAVGVPCISTDCPCGGPKMLFPKSITDYLVSVNDHRKLAERILYVMTHPLELDTLAAECKNAASVFESARIYNKWENIIKDLIRNN